jgi:light-regulated signal transduction histidine kinase (bacteriophytochrome)
VYDLNTAETNNFSGSIFERVADGEWVTAEVWHRKKDGTSFPIEIHAGLIRIKGKSYILGFDRDITIRKVAEEADRMYLAQIKQLNSELHQQAIDLATANNELEAFNYSVSHDMRGPLTLISGYCQVLLGDVVSTDSQVKECITHIYESGIWLNDMIDALLRMAQLTRVELVPVDVNISSIAHLVIRELNLTDPDRKAICTVEEDIVASGDARLLKIMMTNLLHNAWKYSSRSAETRIEFGISQSSGAVPVFFLRDNGVGFDMKDYDKLFRVFSRLHSQSQFSGTGIGLATVQRIVARHGGRVWAEGETGKGATFYFTLQVETDDGNRFT